MNIFVGNLSFDATEADVRKAFEGFGNVASVTIVMDKKGTKSRGFGFVEMPDEQQARAAIAAWDGKEFMGRPLNVSPAHPKSSKTDETRRSPRREEKVQKDSWGKPVFQRTGRYREGRRTRSFLLRRVAEGIEEPALPPRKNRENPMRWRKKQEQPRPWQKKHGESKPWKKAGEGLKPWRKSEGGFTPGRKAEGEPRHWKKGESAHRRPWRKSNERKRRGHPSAK